MCSRYRELLPNSEVVAILERLKTQAILVGNDLRNYRRSPLALEPQSVVVEKMKTLFKTVRDETPELGEIRVIRILRNQTRGIYGIDAGAPDLPLDEAVAVAMQIGENAEREIIAIDQQRILWMTAISAVAAAIAALLAAATLFVTALASIWR
jgi:hypothetical protein